MTSADDVADDVTRADVSRGKLARGGACRHVGARGGAWRKLEARDTDAETSGGAWGRVRGPMKTKFHKKVDRRDFFPMV